MIFETKRLTVRRLTMEDLEAFNRMQSNPTVMKFTGGEVQTLEKSEEELKKLLFYYTVKDNDFFVWAVARKSDNLFIGTCALIVNEEGENEIGYRIDEPFWGNGFATEITEGLIDYAFNTLNYNELYAITYKSNIASVKILDKLFRFEREFFNEEIGAVDREYRLTKNG